MKRWGAFAVSFLLLLTVGCSNGNEQSLPGSMPPSEAPVSESAVLDVSDLNDIFTSADLSTADLTCFFEGTEETFPAGNAIRAGNYLEKLESFLWESVQPPPEWDGRGNYRCQLTIPGATITAFPVEYADACPLHVKTDSGEGWFTLPDIEGEQANWMILDTFVQWHDEAHTAALYGGEGIPLTAEELDWFANYTDSTQTRYDETQGGVVSELLPISCFFTSQYSDPRDIAARDFLWYCPEPSGQAPVDAAEFKRVQEVLDWRGTDGHLLTLEELPTLCFRLPRSYINEILTQYAGITLEEMNTDWMENILYVPSTDCFYTFASDFGPGVFIPCYGEKNGDIVTLWEAPNQESGTSEELTLQKAGENWLIRSFQFSI